MTNEWLIATVVIPVVSWGVSVERRISGLWALTKQVDRVEKQVDKLVDHLIEVPNDKPAS